MIQIRHEEQYSLISPEQLTDIASSDELEKKIVESLENGHRNFILNLEGLNSLTTDIVPGLSKLKAIVEKEDGRFVVACPPAQLEERLEEDGLVSTPTLNEATDYIFMEEIEKQLLDDAGEGWDEEE